MAENAINIPFPPHFYAQFNIPPSASPFGLRSYRFHFVQVQFIFHLSQITAFIIPVLITFLQLKYSTDQNKSTFATRPTTMYVAVSSSVVYYLAYVYVYLHPFSVAAAYYCSFLSGFISVASLASVLLPDSFSPFVYAVFGLLLASEILYWLYHKLVAEIEVRRRRICRFLNNVWRAVSSSTGQRQLQQILPV